MNIFKLYFYLFIFNKLPRFMALVQESSSRKHHQRLTRSTPRERRLRFVEQSLKMHRNANANEEGSLRLIDGTVRNEGTVEIYHAGSWGNICDDEWDPKDGKIVCKQLGFRDVRRVTYSAHFGRVRHKYWLDNMYCFGTETSLSNCRHDGWGVHDCENDEAAGVICETHEDAENGTLTDVFQQLKDESVPDHDPGGESIAPLISESVVGKNFKVRLRGGRIKEEGRVEISWSNSTTWSLICGNDWTIFEAMVVCRQLGLKYAQSAHTTNYFGGNSSMVALNGVKCTGNEYTLTQCRGNFDDIPVCLGPKEGNIAAVTCNTKMADLVPDYLELTRSVVLEDKQLFFLQCAIEENCLAESAYKQQNSGYGWHLETRRLLRFTARIVNQGDEAFRPFLPKNHWEWHLCHMHYHSMEVFAHYDITDSEGKKIAEGHKASFCLEDNNCLPNVSPVFKCANFGDQGISPGCTDTYAYNVDCQWVDITDLQPGKFTFKLEINPEFKVAEQTFDNNAAVCDLIYNEYSAWIGNCTLRRPGVS